MVSPCFGASRIGDGSAMDFLRRSEMTWNDMVAKCPAATALSLDIGRLIEIRAKYEGYIARQDKQIERSSQWETKLIPQTVDYSRVVGLRNEARQKLTKFTRAVLARRCVSAGLRRRM